jgi:hypothetical protein
MSVEPIGYIDLPRHAKPGGFDHAAVHGGLGRLYVAHTANSALDVVDCRAQRYLPQAWAGKPARPQVAVRILRNMAADPA